MDPALIRPGRVDVKEYIGYCSEYQIAKMFEKFYQDSGSNAKIFASEVIKCNKPISAAQLQGFFMMHKQDSLKILLESIPHLWDK